MKESFVKFAGSFFKIVKTDSDFAVFKLENNSWVRIADSLIAERYAL